MLCHFVLQYLPAGTKDLATLADFVRSGGTLSLVLPNPVGMVLRQLVSGGPASAISELRAESKHAVLFDHEVRKVEMGELALCDQEPYLRIGGMYQVIATKP